VGFSNDVLFVFVNAIASAAAVWGVMRTELKYLRRDVDLAHLRISKVAEGRCPVGTNLNLGDKDQ